MDAGVYILVETQWDATIPDFCKSIKDPIKKADTYDNVVMGSKRDEYFEITWKWWYNGWCFREVGQ